MGSLVVRNEKREKGGGMDVRSRRQLSNISAEMHKGAGKH